jgi:hypothetical protein
MRKRKLSVTIMQTGYVAWAVIAVDRQLNALLTATI